MIGGIFVLPLLGLQKTLNINKIANLMEFGKIILKVFDCNLGPAAPLVPGNVELRFLLIVTVQTILKKRNIV
jgi:hypothetical protein